METGDGTAAIEALRTALQLAASDQEQIAWELKGANRARWSPRLVRWCQRGRQCSPRLEAVKQLARLAQLGKGVHVHILPGVLERCGTCARAWPDAAAGTAGTCPRQIMWRACLLTKAESGWARAP